jgi:tetratricopeptide (TPR) repeat protein
MGNKMKKFYYQIISGWHHGGGSKNTRKENYDKALKHFKAALEYALRADIEFSIPVEQECVARTLVRLKDYAQAQKYATDSLDSYKKLKWAGSLFEAGANRVAELLKTIEKREPI